MGRAWISCVALAGVVGWSGCSGKTERGGTEATADKPAVGPSNVPDPKETEPPQSNAQRHVLMVVELELALRTAKVLKVRPVELPLPRRRGPVEKGPWQVDVLDAAGAVLYSAPLADASTVRGEFPDEQGRLSGTRVQKQLASVTLRLPVLQGAATVRVSDLADGQPARELGSVPYPQVQP